MEARELFDAALGDGEDRGVRLRTPRDSVPGVLLDAVDRRRRRYRTRRAAAVLCIVGLGLAIAWPRAKSTATPGRMVADAASSIPVVINAPGIVQRLRIAAPSRSSIEVVQSRPLPPEILIGDSDLVRWLREAGQPAGVIRSGGVFALTEPIAD